MALGTCLRIKFSVSGSIGREASNGSEKDHSDIFVFKFDDVIVDNPATKLELRT